MDRKVVLFFLLALFGGTALIAQQRFPSVQVYSLDGKAVDIGHYARNDRPTVISLWATWCSPCKKELNAIAEMYEDWQEDYGVELLAISIDDQRALAKVAPMAQNNEWPYTILLDTDGALMQALGVQAIPYTILIDQQGNIAYSHSGYAPGDELELEDQIKLIARN